MFDWPAVDRGLLRQHRMGRVRELMAARRCDHLLLTGVDNLRYAVDFRAQLISEAFDWYAAVVDSDGVADVFVPYVDEVVKNPDPELPWIATLQPLPSWAPAITHSTTWARQLATGLERRGARRVGYDTLDAQLLGEIVRELPGRSWTPVGKDLFGARQTKHPIEVTLLAATSVANDVALRAALSSARPGMTDHDLLGEAMRQQQSLGAEFISHSVCNLGKGSGSWFADGTQLREGDSFFLDIGCYGPGGYASDLARTAFLGEPRKPVLDAYRQLIRAHELAQEMARPGRRASELYAAVNALLEGHGLGRTPYSVGHGVGLRACELPTLFRADLMDEDPCLQEGQVIALEPETSVVAGDGTTQVLKIEEIFVIERDGAQCLTAEVPFESLVVSPH